MGKQIDYIKIRKKFLIKKANEKKLLEIGNEDFLKGYDDGLHNPYDENLGKKSKKYREGYYKGEDDYNKEQHGG